MPREVYFITHPEVVIDPAVPVPQWPLSARGRERMEQLLARDWARRIAATIYCSTEQKAIDGATILSAATGVPFQAGARSTKTCPPCRAGRLIRQPGGASRELPTDRLR